jgi:hypothetical protein
VADNSKDWLELWVPPLATLGLLIIGFFLNRWYENHKRRIEIKYKAIGLCERLKILVLEMAFSFCDTQFYHVLQRFTDQDKEKAKLGEMNSYEKNRECNNEYNRLEAELITAISQIAPKLNKKDREKIFEGWLGFKKYVVPYAEYGYKELKSSEEVKAKHRDDNDSIWDSLNNPLAIPSLCLIEEAISPKFFASLHSKIK